MRARYASRCPACGGDVRPGEWIRRLPGGRYGHAVCASVGFTRADMYADTGELDAELRERRRMDADYGAGAAEVAQIQAVSAPGSALREQMYMDMEMAAFNRGDV